MTPRILLVAALLVPALTAADTDPKPVKARALTAANLPGGLGKVETPLRFASEKELAVRVPDAAQRAAIVKQVDFEKEHLVLFSWSGSGGDKLAPTEGKPGEAAFVYTAGFTDDLRRHAHLFAVPAKAKVLVLAGKP